MPAKIVYIETAEQLDELFERSYREPVAIFKHSDTCGISADMLYQTAAVEGEFNVVVIQQHRPLSNEIADRTGYRHQSPQAFVLKDGKPIYHATHYGIDPEKIAGFLKN